MAGEQARDIHEEVQRHGDAKTETFQRKAALESGNVAERARERAAELKESLDALEQSVKTALEVLEKIQMENPAEAEKMQEAFGQQLTHALQILKNNLERTQYSTILIDETRSSIDALTQIANGPPPESGWIFDSPDVDLWIQQLQGKNVITALVALSMALRGSKIKLKEQTDAIATATPSASASAQARNIVEEASAKTGAVVTVQGNQGETWVFKN